jgi:uncharacterized membrane protein YfcA
VRSLYGLPAKQIKIILGGLIALYALYMMLKPAGARFVEYKGWKTGAVVGALGGMIGGFTAFPGGHTTFTVPTPPASTPGLRK